MSARVDPYKVLGVPRDADAAMIKKAYRKASSAAHPDRNGGDTSRMALVNVANDILCDPRRREQFDLGKDDVPPTPPLELRARMQLAMAFQEVLQNPQRVDIPLATRQCLMAKKLQANTNITGLGNMRKHFEKRVKDCGYTKDRDRPNVFEDQVHASLLNLEQQMANTRELIEALDSALDMLKAYTSTQADDSHQGFQQRHFSSLEDFMAAAQGRRAF